MKKLTAREIENLNNMRNDLIEEENNVITALVRYFAMAKIVRETGETYKCKELEEIGQKTMETASDASEIFIKTHHAELQAEWERVRELVRFTWTENVVEK